MNRFGKMSLIGLTVILGIIARILIEPAGTPLTVLISLIVLAAGLAFWSIWSILTSTYNISGEGD